MVLDVTKKLVRQKKQWEERADTVILTVPVAAFIVQATVGSL